MKFMDIQYGIESLSLLHDDSTVSMDAFESEYKDCFVLRMSILLVVEGDVDWDFCSVSNGVGGETEPIGSKIDSFSIFNGIGSVSPSEMIWDPVLCCVDMGVVKNCVTLEWLSVLSSIMPTYNRFTMVNTPSFNCWFNRMCSKNKPVAQKLVFVTPMFILTFSSSSYSMTLHHLIFPAVRFNSVNKNKSCIHY